MNPWPVARISARPANGALLRALSQIATDRIDRPVSSSAVVRALLAYVEHQLPAWAETALVPLIEDEIQAGTLWGSVVNGIGEQRSRKPA